MSWHQVPTGSVSMGGMLSDMWRQLKSDQVHPLKQPFISSQICGQMIENTRGNCTKTICRQNWSSHFIQSSRFTLGRGLKTRPYSVSISDYSQAPRVKNLMLRESTDTAKQRSKHISFRWRPLSIQRLLRGVIKVWSFTWQYDIDEKLEVLRWALQLTRHTAFFVLCLLT